MSLIEAVSDAVESRAPCAGGQKRTSLVRVKSPYYRSVLYTSLGLLDEDSFVARLCQGFYTWACRTAISQHFRAFGSAAIVQGDIGSSHQELGQHLLALLEGMHARFGFDAYCSQAYQEDDCEEAEYQEVLRAFHARLSVPHRRSTNTLWIDLPARQFAAIPISPHEHDMKACNNWIETIYEFRLHTRQPYTRSSADPVRTFSYALSSHA